MHVDRGRRKEHATVDDEKFFYRAPAPSANDLRDTEQVDLASSERVTIALEEPDLAALKRILGSLADAGANGERTADESTGKRLAELMFDMRKARSRLFPASMFNEPAWDMLMALYIADEVPAAADLARWTGTPISSAMRWIEYLEKHRLIVRELRPKDRRAHSIRLTTEARSSMEALFSEVVTKWP